MSLATEYLQSYQDYFWRYEDQGKVITVPDGRTLGYTDQVISEIVFHLAPQGLPRFGSLLLAIAATTAHGNDTLEDIIRIVETRDGRTEEVEKGIWFAKLLTQVPAKFKLGNFRILLLQAVFMRSHNGISRKKSVQILQELRAVPSIAEYTAAWKEKGLTQPEIRNSLIEDFRVLALIGRKLKDVPTIMERIAGLPSVTHALQDLEVVPEPNVQAGSLIDQLLDHPDTFHVGALVASLISGLQISFHASLPSEQPLGGVADITNKGSFDKLLTSEYAFDDHVLLSRLANNEALYKHREIPPADNTNPRVILIDTTLKNWGTIRSIAIATAIAIAQHPKNKQPCRVFTVGKSYQEMAITTMMDVIIGLNTLDNSLDPGVGLEKLLAQEDLAASELFFVGTAESLASPVMQRISGAADQHIDHWIHPEENGVLKVYKHPKRGKRFVQELKIPIEKLWSAKPKALKIVLTLDTTGYPILFPEMKMKATWKGKRFIYGLTKRKGLVRLFAGKNQETFGWEFIAGGIRPMDNLKAVITHGDLSVTVLFATDTKKYTVVKYPGGEEITVGLDRRLKKAKTFYVEDSCFKTNLSRTVVCIDTQGQITEQVLILTKTKIVKPFRNRNNNFFHDIKSVSISMDNKLRFRKHDLLLENGHIFIQHRPLQRDIKLAAVESEPDKFVFPDGSIVAFNPSGMLTLKSANPKLPEIFVPTQLDFPLGVATQEVFSGKRYYRKAPRIELIISYAIGTDSQVAGLINQCLDRVNLKRAEEMAKNGIIVCPDEASLAKLELALAGFSYRVQRRGIHQREIAPREFYQQYIESFIANIFHHGTNA